MIAFCFFGSVCFSSLRKTQNVQIYGWVFHRFVIILNNKAELIIHSKRKRSQNNLILGCIIHNLVRIKMTTLNNFESTAEGAYLEHVVCWRFRRKLLVGLVRAVYIPARHREHPCALLSCPRAEQKTALGWEVGAIEKQTMYSSCSATIAERS